MRQQAPACLAKTEQQRLQRQPPSPRAGAGWVSTQAALKSLPWETHLPPAQAALACPCRAPVTTGSHSSTAAFCPAQPRQGEETPGLPCCSSEPAAPQNRSSPFAPPPGPGAHGAQPRGTVLSLPRGIHHVPSAPAEASQAAAAQGLTTLLGEAQTSCSLLPTALLRGRNPPPLRTLFPASLSCLLPQTRAQRQARCSETQPGPHQPGQEQVGCWGAQARWRCFRMFVAVGRRWQAGRQLHSLSSPVKR